MTIIDVLYAPGLGAFFYDDQAAIREGVERDGFVYRGTPRTSGFDRIRMPAQSLGIGLVLETGDVVWGDMMSVQYSGAGGRDPVFESASAQAFCDAVVTSRLIGLEVNNFRTACGTALAPHAEARLPLAVEYGVSQALLRAAALAARCSMAEIISREFACPLVARPVPLYAQSGDSWDVSIDKMILKHVDIMPHGLINAVSKIGRDGQIFLDFLAQVARRIGEIGRDDYRPILHFDVYGWIGLIHDNDIQRIASFIARAAERALPFRLQIESPADFGSRSAQIAGLRALMDELGRIGCDAKIVADEWCNTLEDIRAFADARAADLIQIKMPDVGSVADTASAVLACKERGVGSYVGGSCVETDLSAQVSVHIAVATQADMLLAKPGMGVDEGLTIVGNEQARLLALLRRRMSRRA